MKFSKKSLLIMGSIFTLASLGLMVFSVMAEENVNETSSIKLGINPNNAIQHFENVKIISTGDNNTSATIDKKDNLIGINTANNFILTKTGSETNKITTGISGSSILGGIKNTIKKGTNETILGGKNNEIGTNRTGDSSSILGGVGNELEGGENSTIFGGSGNEINGDNSSIIGSEGNSIMSDYSTVIGNNSEVYGNNSIAMGKNIEVNPDNSFLWTDSFTTDDDTNGNIFVINGENGMVVNTKKAHNTAKLTIAGSLIIYSGDAPACDSATKGVLKVVNGTNRTTKCLCNCDGRGRNAVYDGDLCSFKCQNQAPNSVKCDPRNTRQNGKTYTGSCENGTVVQGTGAFLITTEIDNGGGLTNYIHRSCQSYTGQIINCKKELTGPSPDNLLDCQGNIPSFADPVTGSQTTGLNRTEYYIAYNSGDRKNEPCAYYCHSGYYAINGICQKCNGEGETLEKQEDGSYKCITKSTCTGGQIWIPEKGCGRPGTCYNKNGKNVKPNDINLKNAQQQLKDVLPSSGNIGTITCIDGDQYTGEYSPNTCSYKCNTEYYCDGDNGCKKPKCKLNPEELNISGIVVLSGNIHHYWFDRAPTHVNSVYNNDPEKFKKEYKNKEGCWIRCPEENRERKINGSTVSYKCVETGNDLKFCGTLWLYGYGNYYTGNARARWQGWKYVSPQEFAQKNGSSDTADSCIWTCDTGSIVINGGRFSMSPGNEGAGYRKPKYRLLFNSTAKFCYKPCTENQILNTKGECVTCGSDEMPRPDSIQTGVIFDKDATSSYIYSDKSTENNTITSIEKPFVEIGNGKGEISDYYSGYYLDYKSTNRTGKTFSEYRICTKACTGGKVWRDGECRDAIGAEVCENEGKKYVPGTGGAQGRCEDCMDTHIASGDQCILKSGWLDLTINLTGNKKAEYQSGDEIKYEITIANKGNLELSGINIYVYYLSGDKPIRKLTREYKILNTGKQLTETNGFTLSGSIINSILGKNSTGSLNLYLTGSGIPTDTYINKNTELLDRFMKTDIKNSPLKIQIAKQKSN